MTKIQLRRDTASNFASINPILAAGECGFETDTNKLKIGNGTSAWNNLPYLAGEGGGGSIDAYTKIETDELLDKKQDKLTPVEPISITEFGKPTSEGFTIDGSNVHSDGVGQSSSWYKDGDRLRIYQYILRNLYNDNGVIKTRAYIDVPYKIGQILYADLWVNVDPQCGAFGKVTDDGEFIPIMPQALPYGAYINMSDDIYLEGEEYQANLWTNSVFSDITQRGDKTSNWNDWYTQLYLTDDGAIKCCGKYSGTPLLNYDITDESAINRLKEINTFRIYPCCFQQAAYKGAKADDPYDLTKIGVYNTTEFMMDMSQDKSSPVEGLENLFNISESQAANQLKLNIGDGLQVANGKLTTSGLKLVEVTQEEYTNLENKDPNTLYLITDGQSIDDILVTKVDLRQATRASFPSGRYTDLELGATGSRYDAPDDGWFLLHKGANNAEFCQFTTSTGYVGFANSIQTYGQAITAPVRKGDTVTVSYNLTGDTMRFIFIYAEGVK